MTTIYLNSLQVIILVLWVLTWITSRPWRKGWFLFLYLMTGIGLRKRYSPRASKFNAHLVGFGVPNYKDDIGTDLAVLSRCNHTVLSHGTFSFWAGFLAGGKRILPYMILNGKVKDLDKKLDPFMLPDEKLMLSEAWRGVMSDTIRRIDPRTLRCSHGKQANCKDPREELGSKGRWGDSHF